MPRGHLFLKRSRREPPPPIGTGSRVAGFCRLINDVPGKPGLKARFAASPAAALAAVNRPHCIVK